MISAVNTPLLHALLSYENSFQRDEPSATTPVACAPFWKIKRSRLSLYSGGSRGPELLAVRSLRRVITRARVPSLAPERSTPDGAPSSRSPDTQLSISSNRRRAAAP